MVGELQYLSYLTSFERLNDDKVPEKKYFFNDITKKDISNEEYNNVKMLWDLFEMR